MISLLKSGASTTARSYFAATVHVHGTFVPHVLDARRQTESSLVTSFCTLARRKQREQLQQEHPRFQMVLLHRWSRRTGTPMAVKLDAVVAWHRLCLLQFV